MKNKIKLLGYAVSPLIIGNIVNLLITKLGWYGFSLTIISILFCCYWIFIGYKIAGYSNTYIESALIVNSLAIMCYVTVLMSEMLQGSFVANMIRVQAQIFFLPMLRVVAIILGDRKSTRLNSSHH